MDRFEKLVLPLILLSGLFFSTAPAHETKTIGSLSVLLHMEPQDSPVVQEPAQLFLAFTDSRGDFDIESCVCRISILDKNEIIFEKNLESAEKTYGSNVATINFTFPKKGIYQLVVKGDSTSGKFNGFSVTYDIRIERESVKELPVNPVVEGHEKIKTSYIIYTFGSIGFFVIIFIGLRKNKRR